MMCSSVEDKFVLGHENTLNNFSVPQADEYYYKIFMLRIYLLHLLPATYPQQRDSANFCHFLPGVNLFSSCRILCNFQDIPLLLIAHIAMCAIRRSGMS